MTAQLYNLTTLMQKYIFNLKNKKNSITLHGITCYRTEMTIKICNLLLSVLLTAMTVVPAAARDAGTDFAPVFTNHPKYEVRAVWLTTLGGLDWPRNRAEGPAGIERQKRELCAILDRLAAAGMNTVILQTRVRATVIYPSATEPWDACLTGTEGRAPGYDPLAFAVAESHKRGMEIQAWVVAVPAGRWASAACRRLRRQHAGMVEREGDQGYIDPSHPAAAAYIAGICREIVSLYDVDGIHLDYIRYPEAAAPRSGRRRATGAERRHNITAIVSAVHDSIKAVKPWVKLSCAAIGRYAGLPRRSSGGWSAYGCGQDVRRWLDSGLVDQIYPMLYYRGGMFYPFALDWCENSDGHTLAAGLALYKLSRREGDWPLDEIARQLQVARSLGMGYALFREEFLGGDEKGVYGYVKDVLNSYPALVPPAGAACGPSPGRPAGLDVVRSADGTTSVTWTAGGGAEPCCYNVYASSTYPVDIDDARNLIAPRARQTGISVKTRGRMYYAVTAVDRYGRESAAAQQQAADAAPLPCGGMMANDGREIVLRAAGGDASLDAEYILLKSLAGTIVAARRVRGQRADISDVPDGFYSVYSLDRRAVGHRLGFVMIRRNNN